MAVRAASRLVPASRTFERPGHLCRLALAGVVAATVLLGCATSDIIDDPLVARVYETIGAGDVTVRNDDGVISLGGFVEGVGVGQEYEEAVSRIPGVRAVENNLIVRGDDG